MKNSLLGMAMAAWFATAGLASASESASRHLSSGDFTKLAAGDTQQTVIGKLGNPIRPKEAMTWLMYYAEGRKNFYYLVLFDNQPGEPLRAGSRVVKVILSDLQHPPTVVWPGA